MRNEPDSIYQASSYFQSQHDMIFQMIQNNKALSFYQSQHGRDKYFQKRMLVHLAIWTIKQIYHNLKIEIFNFFSNNSHLTVTND